jgi:hypothetical protein
MLIKISFNSIIIKIPTLIRASMKISETETPPISPIIIAFQTSSKMNQKINSQILLILSPKTSIFK